jgi:hypothetical protein
MPVTIHELALHRLELPTSTTELNGAQFAEAGLAILGGCEVCRATLAAYNACPSKSGYWRCLNGCIGDAGWDDVAQASRDIFESEQTAPDEYEEDPYPDSDLPPSWFDPSYAGESWEEES